MANRDYEHTYIPLHIVRPLNEKYDLAAAVGSFDMIGTDTDGSSAICHRWGGIERPKESTKSIYAIIEEYCMKKELDRHNEDIRQRAIKRGIPESALDEVYGWLQYPMSRVIEGMETIRLDDRVLGNCIHLYHIPENGKWVRAVEWVSNDRYEGMASYPSPIWDCMYDTREEALNSAWECLEGVGLKRKTIQGDLFGGNYE